jgi:UrcA family protein
MTKTNFIVATLLGLSLAQFSAPVAAQDTVVEARQSDQGLKQARVNIADLNLHGDAGVSALNDRVMAAAGRVCAGIDTRQYRPGPVISWGRCRRVTVAAAKPQLDALIARAKSGEQIVEQFTLSRR